MELLRKSDAASKPFKDLIIHHAGKLQKWVNIFTGWQQRYVLIASADSTSYFLAYAVDEDCFQQNQFRKRLSLQQFIVEPMPGQPARFSVALPTETLYFIASSEEDALVWRKILQDLAPASLTREPATDSKGETAQPPSRLSETDDEFADEDGWEAVATFDQVLEAEKQSQQQDEISWLCSVQHSIAAADDLIISCKQLCKTELQQADEQEGQDKYLFSRTISMHVAKFHAVLEELIRYSSISTMTDLPPLPSRSFFTLYFSTNAAVLERNRVYTQWLQHLVNVLPKSIVMYTVFQENTPPSNLFLSRTQLSRVALEVELQQAEQLLANSLVELEKVTSQSPSGGIAMHTAVAHLDCLCQLLSVKESFHANKQKMRKSQLHQTMAAINSAMDAGIAEQVMARQLPLSNATSDISARAQSDYDTFIQLKTELLLQDQEFYSACHALVQHHVGLSTRCLENNSQSSPSRARRQRLKELLELPVTMHKKTLQARIKSIQWCISGFSIEVMQLRQNLELLSTRRNVDDNELVNATFRRIQEIHEQRLETCRSLLANQEALCTLQLTHLNNQKSDYSNSRAKRKQAESSYMKWQQRLAIWRAAFRETQHASNTELQACSDVLQQYEKHTSSIRKRRSNKVEHQIAMQQTLSERRKAKNRILEFQSEQQPTPNSQKVPLSDTERIRQARKEAVKRIKANTLDVSALPPPMDQQEFEQEQREQLKLFRQRTKLRIQKHDEQVTMLTQQRELELQTQLQLSIQEQEVHRKQTQQRLKERKEISLKYQYAHAPGRLPKLADRNHLVQCCTNAKPEDQQLPPPPLTWLEAATPALNTTEDQESNLQEEDVQENEAKENEKQGGPEQKEAKEEEEKEEGEAGEEVG
eukprot:m.158820 g.158820  ORF g.158820 m.158820 type:complete len:875 (-) comp16340_c4_seq1:214-2838(-)